MRIGFLILILSGFVYAQTEITKSQVVIFNVDQNCRMYSDECVSIVAVDESIDLKMPHLKSADENLLTIVSLSPFSCSNAGSNRTDEKCPQITNSDIKYKFYKIELYAHLIGQIHVIFFSNSTKYERVRMPINFREPMRFVDKFFKLFVWTLGTFFSVTLGILLDRDQLLTILEKPIAPICGLLIQVICMPLLSFGFVTFFNFGPIEALSLFLYGCCPGGSASNNWTILFNGDINLSAIMTFFSNTTTLFTIPLWLYTLGSVLMDKADIQIPFSMLLLNLVIVVAPCLIGLLISIKYPNLRKLALKIIKPLTMFLVAFMLFIVFTTKSWAFRLMKWEYFLAAPAIPWFGYVLAMSAAFLLRLPWQQIKTIGIETGIQNVGVAFLIILTNFPSPQAEYAMLPLISVAIFTAIPLVIIYIISRICGCIVGRKKEVSDVELKNIRGYLVVSQPEY